MYVLKPNTTKLYNELYSLFKNSDVGQFHGEAIAAEIVSKIHKILPVDTITGDVSLDRNYLAAYWLDYIKSGTVLLRVKLGLVEVYRQVISIIEKHISVEEV